MAVRVVVRAEHEQLRDALGLVDRDVEGDLAAVAPPDERGLADLERVHHGDDVAGHLVVAKLGLGQRAAPLAAAIDDDDLELVDERPLRIRKISGVADI